ncbi:hypothetical protein B296_00045646 [Ensete ventricosum]|uniref:Uncharacterized protein n=1 Tax=Ensete ventricosum TaxID=4639 RepID=A0A426Z6S4_ENSVE|nr:hypothetical protein B296_00045646 [Ensete ventricosum]
MKCIELVELQRDIAPDLGWFPFQGGDSERAAPRGMEAPKRKRMASARRSSRLRRAKESVGGGEERGRHRPRKCLLWDTCGENSHVTPLYSGSMIAGILGFLRAILDSSPTP